MIDYWYLTMTGSTVWNLLFRVFIFSGNQPLVLVEEYINNTDPGVRVQHTVVRQIELRQSLISHDLFYEISP